MQTLRDDSISLSFRRQVQKRPRLRCWRTRKKPRRLWMSQERNVSTRQRSTETNGDRLNKNCKESFGFRRSSLTVVLGWKLEGSEWVSE